MLNRMRNDEGGFTLIELLVVILIIGILAAIALPTFLGQQAKGQDSSAKSNARNAVSQIESCFSDAAPQSYASCDTAAELGTTGLTFVDTTPDAANEVQVTGAGATGYAVTAYSASGNMFTITKSANGIVRSCTYGSDRGGCTGAWGTAAAQGAA